MAILRNGKHLSGKAGASIFSSWRDIQTVKGLHKRRKTKKEPTKNQAIQRMKWALMSHFLGLAWNAVEKGFSGAGAKRKTPRNIALSYNLKRAIKEGPEGPYIDYREVVFSMGKLPAPSDVQLQCKQQQFSLSWSPAITSGMLAADDNVHVLIYNVNKDFMIYYGANVCRADGMLQAQLPESQKGDTFHAYIFFSSQEGFNSPSLYVGEFKTKA